MNHSEKLKTRSKFDFQERNYFEHTNYQNCLIDHSRTKKYQSQSSNRKSLLKNLPWTSANHFDPHCFLNCPNATAPFSVPNLRHFKHRLIERIERSCAVDNRMHLQLFNLGRISITFNGPTAALDLWYSSAYLMVTAWAAFSQLRIEGHLHGLRIVCQLPTLIKGPSKSITTITFSSVLFL